jgi:hypothetical protein
VTCPRAGPVTSPTPTACSFTLLLLHCAKLPWAWAALLDFVKFQRRLRTLMPRCGRWYFSEQSRSNSSLGHPLSLIAWPWA